MVPRLLEEAVQARQKLQQPLEEGRLLGSFGCYYADIGEPVLACHWYTEAMKAYSRVEAVTATYHTAQHRMGFMMWRLGARRGRCIS